MGIKKVIKKKVEEPVQEVKVEENKPVSTKKGLRDIIDREKLFTMIYSGVENEKYFNVLYDAGIRNFLMSYHYIKSKKVGISSYAEKGIKLFIDSGAYTYQANPEYENYTNEQWESQIVQYLSWAKANKEAIFAIANLDLENLVGVDIVREWNRKYFEPFMIETGIPVCFIWHPIIGDSGWEQMCQRYPYVGYSWVADDGLDLDFNFGKRMLDVARKYNSVCHGMGMTRTALLPKLPFYTVDSTTWLVGLQYGEINYWTGKKMTRLKKDKWKGSELPKLLKLGLNEKLLIEEDTIEMIRANIFAFIEAEQYIQTRLKQRMYWLSPLAVTNDIDSEDIFEIFPSLEWVAGEEDPNYSDWEDYARKLNINPEVGRDTALGMIIDCTCMCSWDKEEFQQFNERVYLGEDDLIGQMHDMYINQVVGTQEEKLEQLKDFFWSVVSGKNDKLLTWGQKAETKERETYIEDEKFDYVDVSLDEYNEVIQKCLPPPSEEDIAPDIAELDKEIFDNTGYVAVRDNKGRFIKGQKAVRKPKNIYSEKYPKLICDTCYASQGCPQFKEGYVCAFNKMFKRFDVRDAGDIMEAMQGMVNLNMERMQRVAIFEMIDGGMPDGNLTSMIDQNMRLLQNMKAIYDYGGEVLRHTKTVNADGSVQETTSVNNGGQSILEKLFSGMKTTSEEPKEEEKPRDNIVDVEAVEVKE